MAYGNVDKFRKPHSSDGGSGNTTNVYIGSGIDNGNLRVTNLTAANIDANRIIANNIETKNAKFKYIMSEYGEIKKIEGNELNYKIGQIDDLKCSNIETNELKVNDTATIENIINNVLSSKNITTDYLTVNKSAYFFELVIDKIRSIQGTQINTAANCVLDYVEAYDINDELVDLDDNSVRYYRVYWKNKEESEDGSGKEITNDWLPLDQALCESFNVNVGVNQNVNNQYYWRKVLAVDNGNIKYINLNIGDVQDNEVTDYEIVFPNGFKYVDQSETEEFTDFTVESQVAGEWDGTDTWTVGSTQYGLQITLPDYTSANGTFVFNTQSDTKLNVGVYYSDGTFGYFPGDVYKKDYSIATETDKMIEAFVIICPKIEKWYACNWIDLSNIYNAVKPDYDPTVMYNEDGTPKGGIPKAGDNVVQLGYRYDELANPTQDDIDRASAIIIAAYKTPDAGDQLVSPAIPPIYPPSYAQYQRINDFNLAHHRKTYFDAQRSQFIGDFKVVANNTEVDLNTYIQQQTTPASVDVAVRVPGPNSTWVDYSLCVLQSTGNNVITDLNNFPSQMRLQIINYTSSTSLSVQAASLELFGRTINLLNPNDTAQGIYVSSVTTPGTDYLLINFGYRGTASQTIPNGSAMKFSGQITVSGTTYHPSATIPITVVNSMDGTDGEVYTLKKEIEKAQVDNLGTLRTNLQYKINHIDGLTADVLLTDTNFYLWIHKYDQNGSEIDPGHPIKLYAADYNTNGYWSWSETITDWFSNNMSGKPFYYVVELYNNNDEVYDTSVVNIQLLGTSLFEVKNGLASLILTNSNAIADNAQAIADETSARNLQYLDIQADYSGVSSRVTDLETDVTGIHGTISTIDQKADRISARVDNVEDGLQTTGIDIESGKITITAENTIIDGNLNIHNANEGLIVYDNATDTPKIAVVGDSIGNYDDYTGGLPTYLHYNASGIVGSGKFTSNRINLGTYRPGEKFSLTNGNVAINNGGNSYNITLITAKLYADSTLVQTYTTSNITGGQYEYYGYEFEFSITPFTISSSNQYYLVLEATTNAIDANDGIFAVWVAKYTSNMNKVAMDGAIFGDNKDNCSWLGQNEIVLSHDCGDHNGIASIRIDDDGVKYHTPQSGNNYYAEIGSMTTVAKVSSGTYYYAKPTDGFITLRYGIQEMSHDGDNHFVLWLPDPAQCEGKIYYVKRVGTDKDVRVYAWDDVYQTYIQDAFLDEDSSTTTETYESIGGDGRTYISDGWKWIEFYNE